MHTTYRLLTLRTSIPPKESDPEEMANALQERFAPFTDQYNDLDVTTTHLINIVDGEKQPMRVELVFDSKHITSNEQDEGVGKYFVSVNDTSRTFSCFSLSFFWGVQALKTILSLQLVISMITLAW